MRVQVDGQEYQVPELDDLTFREANLIKRLTGLRAGEYAEAFNSGDTDMALGIAVIAMYRAGKLTDLNPDVLLDMRVNAVDFIAEEGDEEAVVGPPAEDGGPDDSDAAEPSEE